jgi:hypothetical protein
MRRAPLPPSRQPSRQPSREELKILPGVNPSNDSSIRAFGTRPANSKSVELVKERLNLK